MVWKIDCDCNKRDETEIDSQKKFKEIKDFFEQQVSDGIFKEITVSKPYYIGYSDLQKKEIKWYADKWYICKSCGCLWELDYPDFPASGFVRKFEDGKYEKVPQSH